MNIDYAQIELEARRLRAEMVKTFFAKLFGKSDKAIVAQPV